MLGKCLVTCHTLVTVGISHGFSLLYAKPRALRTRVLF